jgi:GTP pyrophosphokinase
MVKLKDKAYILPDGSISVEGWIQEVEAKRGGEDLQFIRHACSLTQLAETDHPLHHGFSCLQQGLSMADLLMELSLDSEAVAAGIVYGSVQHAELSLEDVAEHLGSGVAKLVRGAKQMDAIRLLDEYSVKDGVQTENIRKMLLAMVEDIRVVLIKLAESVYLLRAARYLNSDAQVSLARQILHLYAPLANRLGLSQLKWELEDRAFRYLNPDVYQELSLSINQSRLDRERYIVQMSAELQDWITAAHIKKAEITGRAKHIYSIYRKMTRKHVGYDEIYDVNALRVLVPSIEDCYTVLSIVHTQWEPIKKEFDDYIATPKSNGYRSIHTAVIADEGRMLEVQIRTFDMHHESELGGAAHWRYKEGAQQQAGYDAKIAWLRQVLEWQKELVGGTAATDKQHSTVFDDRAYVFTPDGKIIDLPQGATPLDFAYHVHSEVGHRCRGAKVNGHIVPLTSALHTGDRVEILTTKHPAPSRDWLNPHLGYLKTSRARAKVHHWLKFQDFDKNVAEGRAILDKELDRLGIEKPDYDKLAPRLNFKKSEDIFAALGCGDIRLSQILNGIQAILEPSKRIVEQLPIKVNLKPTSIPSTHSGIYIQGVGNLVTQFAKCCKPLPGEPITGYITTQGRGVMIHSQDCQSVLNAMQKHPERLIETTWGDKPNAGYAADIFVIAYDRPGLIRDITTILSNEKLNVMALNTKTDPAAHLAHTNFTIEINGLDALSRVLNSLKQLPNVVEVGRKK